MNIELFPLKDFFKNPEMLLAHVSPLREDETLEQHLTLTMDYYAKLCQAKHIDESVLKCIRMIEITIKKNDISQPMVKLGEESVKLVYQLFCNAIWLHDLGKGNDGFQVKKMANKAFKNKFYDETNHSKLGAALYVFHTFKWVNKQIDEDSIEVTLEEHQMILMFIMGFGYTIAKHHGRLNNDFSESPEKFQKEVLAFIEDEGLGAYHPSYSEAFRENEEIIEQLFGEPSSQEEANGFIGYLGESMSAYYLIIKLLHGLIIACDFYATGEYMSGSKPSFGCIEDIDSYIEQFEQQSVIKSIRHYEQNKACQISEINKMRSSLFLEAEKNILKYKDEKRFYLEAPTGSGKTLTSLNLALKLMESDRRLNKLYYIFPFNTLSEQTEKVLSAIFEDKDITVINYITPIKVKESDQGLDRGQQYNDAYQNHIHLHYPVTLLSHVGLFNRLFSTGKLSALPLVHLSNSVIILDELQCYDNSKWREMIELLERYSEALNIRFIFMSATLPKLSELSQLNDLKTISLIENPTAYFQSACFKDRVQLNFDLITKMPIDESILIEKVSEEWMQRGQSRILVEFVQKKMARSFFKVMSERFPNKRIEELTGDDNIYYRNKLIGDLKKEGKDEVTDILLIATQVIEAGVDIDMTIGFKDISFIDAEEQFLGRINRSFKRKNAMVFFFNAGGSDVVYRNDLRMAFTLKEEQWRIILREKTFSVYFEALLQKIQMRKEELNAGGIKSFYAVLEKMDFIEIERRLKLIDQETYQIFLGYKMDMSLYGGEGYKDGVQLWSDYKTLLEAPLPFTEKQVKLSVLKKEISLFTYTVYDEPIQRDDAIGRLYYVEDAERFIDQGKFNREKYCDVMKTSENTLFM